MRVRFDATWRPEGLIIHTGTYDVPQDMPQELAQRAITERVAVRVDEPVVVAPDPKKQPRKTISHRSPT